MSLGFSNFESSKSFENGVTSFSLDVKKRVHQGLLFVVGLLNILFESIEAAILNLF